MMDMSSLNQLCIETGFQIGQWPTRSGVKTSYFYSEQRCFGDSERFKKDIVGRLLTNHGGIVLKNAYRHFPDVFPQADEKALGQFEALFESTMFVYNPETNHLYPVHKFLTIEEKKRMVSFCNEAIVCLIEDESPTLLLNYLFMNAEDKADFALDILKKAIIKVAEQAQLKEKTLDYVYDFAIMNFSN